MPIRLVGHNEDQLHFFEEIQHDIFRPGDLNDTLAAFDADGTMFPDDIGVLFFIQKLFDPHYWNDYDETTFAELVLPDKYFRIFQNGAEGNDKEFSPELCSFIIGLASDIIVLFKETKKLVAAGDFKGKDIHGINTDPLINEFARKMIALDKAIISIDTALSTRLENELLLRTRFLHDRFTDDIRDITTEVWANTLESVDLRVNQSSHINSDTKKIQHDHPLLHGASLPIRLRPNAGRRSLEIAHRLLVPGDTAIVRVVTTNHPLIIDQSIRESAWNEILHSEPQRIRPEDPLVVGTRNKRDKSTQRLTGSVKKTPVIGAAKRDIVMDLEKNLRRKCRIVLGDTPGDLQMGIRAAFEQNGLFAIIVHQNGASAEEAINHTKKRFHDAMVRTGLTNNIPAITQRFYYVMPSEIPQANRAVRVA